MYTHYTALSRVRYIIISSTTTIGVVLALYVTKDLCSTCLQSNDWQDVQVNAEFDKLNGIESN